MPTTYIKTMEDPVDGSLVAPRTVAQAVYLPDNSTVADKIAEMDIQKTSNGRAIAIAMIFG